MEEEDARGETVHHKIGKIIVNAERQKAASGRGCELVG
jgi:hypothetical protein